MDGLRMKSKIRLISITLIGDRKNYSVIFHKGLNYISGHTSTGKTSILEMIDYAFGAKKHKSYIEIGSSCSHVELMFCIGENKYKIVRELFNFKAPVIIEEWDETKDKFVFLNQLDIDAPSNPRSLSAFLIEKLGIADMSISNQVFSFRDVYKYCYIKQTEIDNENIMDEKSWEKNFKRKATFEIIFNIYDKALEQYKNSLEDKKIELKELQIKLSGIKEFLKSVDVESIEECVKIEIELRKEIDIIKSELVMLKNSENTKNGHSLILQKNILKLKVELEKIMTDINDQKQHISKLRLLHNQYVSEIEKKELAIQGYLVFNRYEFVFCPHCLKPINKMQSIERCCLCGSEKTDDSSALIITKKDITILKRKTTEIIKFIEGEECKLDNLLRKKSKLEQKLAEEEIELRHLTHGYVNPDLERIEFLNYEIGKKNRLIFEVQRNLKMFEEVDRYYALIKDKEHSVALLKNNIKELKKNAVDKHELLHELSEKYANILKEFNYPKLNQAYIDETHYLPYVRGRKYDDIGSLAGVTLITMAYYIAILLVGTTSGYYHPGLLIIDSPRKNLGAQAAKDESEEFKDEKIFNSIIRCICDIADSLSDDVQFIVVNNGYPEFLPKDCIVAEFSAEEDNDLPVGLIDDAAT